ncbi:baseplate I-like protein [Pararheinheimera phage vB_PsoM_KLER1-1]|nr:baseplate I-like protein [Pararheinheimera phage vB_PsoM_KLER1-1]
MKVRDIQTVNLADLIPPSIASDPQVVAAVAAINTELQSVTAQIQQTILLARLDELPDNVLDQLAWHYNAPFYLSTYSLSQKRNAIRRAIYWRRIAGTKAAVLEALAALNYNSTISEWFEFSGVPYTFTADIDTNGSEVSANIFTDVVDLIDKTKNARSHLARLRIQTKNSAQTYAGAATVHGAVVEVFDNTVVDILNATSRWYHAMNFTIPEDMG